MALEKILETEKVGERTMTTRKSFVTVWIEDNNDDDNDKSNDDDDNVDKILRGAILGKFSL